MSLDAEFARAEQVREPGEKLWWYECDVPPICGVVIARDEESAMDSAVDDAHDRASEYVAAGTWTLREVEV